MLVKLQPFVFTTSGARRAPLLCSRDGDMRLRWRGVRSSEDDCPEDWRLPREWQRFLQPADEVLRMAAPPSSPADLTGEAPAPLFQAACNKKARTSEKGAGGELSDFLRL